MNKKWINSLEMVAIMTVIGVVTIALVSRIWNIWRRANDTARMLDIRSIATALIHYWVAHDTYPVWTNTSQLTMLIWPDYWLVWAIPKDPHTKEPYSYKTLENNKHFVVCAKMSYDSTIGNTDRDYAKTIGKWNNDSEYSVATYNWTLEKFGNSWKYYCYAG